MWDRKAHSAPRRLSRAETSGTAANMRTAGWPLTTGWFWHLHIRHMRTWLLSWNRAIQIQKSQKNVCHIVCYIPPLDCSISAYMRTGMCISAQSLHILFVSSGHLRSTVAMQSPVAGLADPEPSLDSSKHVS